MPNTGNVTTDEKMAEIYKTEQNVSIRTFFDSGWYVDIGDANNGYTKSDMFDSFTEAVNWLYKEIVDGTSKA